MMLEWNKRVWSGVYMHKGNVPFFHEVRNAHVGVEYMLHVLRTPYLSVADSDALLAANGRGHGYLVPGNALVLTPYRI